MPAKFAESVFTKGTIRIGSDSRRSEVREIVVGDAATDRSDAVARVDAALERMRSNG